MYSSQNSNYMFSLFNNSDLKDYLNYLKTYLIEYRSTIDLDKNITFGLEFEYEDIDQKKVDQFVRENLKTYKSKEEKEFEIGGEIISCPLQDTKKTWIEVKKVCDYLKQNKGVVDRNAGSHIHIGAYYLKDINSFKKLLMLYIAYEHILYRFGNGESNEPRANQISAAYPISIDLAQIYKDILKTDDFIKLNALLVDSRFRGLNFNNVKFNEIENNAYKNTIEFRMCNGTKEEIIWQNIANTFTKIVDSSVNKEFDMDKLIYKVEKIKEYNNYLHFNHLNINDALEFADIVFSNNLDKTNFLKQYIKDGQTSNDYKLKNNIYRKKFIKG